MAIQNIQAIVDKNGLDHLSENLMEQYYTEALVNLGQRNTNDTLLEYVSFSIDELFDSLNYYLIIENNNNGLKYYTFKSDLDISINNDIIIEHYEDLFNNENFEEISISFNNENTEVDLILLNKLNIVNGLFNKIVEYLGKENDNTFKIYIPINYDFKYSCNGINKLIFYNNVKDIYVNLLPFVNYSYNINSFDFEHNIFCFTQNNFIKTVVFDFYFDENNVLYNTKFVLPYIDNDDNWVINDQITNINARSEEAINLNIILAYNYKENGKFKYKFLSGLNNVNYEKISLLDNPENIFIDINGKICECHINLISIDDGAIDNLENGELNSILKNSTLIILSKISDLTDDVDALEYHKNGLVTTIWKYNNIENKYEYISIENDSNNHPIALDFNKITNFDNLLKYKIENIAQIEPDNYLFTYVIFDQIYQTNKQSTTTKYSYPVIQNIKGFNYNNKYINNMNFSLRYVNNISGEIGKSITKVSHNGEKYFFPNKQNNYVTNSLYQYIVNNKINYYNEYIPNYNVPTLDLSEVLTKDINAINKYNILSFDYLGQVYYSYIGTSYEGSKNILRIGTSNTNINLGEKTLIDNVSKSEFNKQNLLSVDFENIVMNGNVTINNDITVNGNLKLNKPEWIINTVNNKEIRTTTIVPQFKYYNYKGNNYTLINIDKIESEISALESNLLSENNNNKYGENSENLYLNIILYVEKSVQDNLPYYYKYNDLLVLENLIPYLGLDKNSVIYFESTTNDIIKIDGKSKYLVSSNNALSDIISIVNTTNTGISIDINDSKEFYIGNILYITYIPSEYKLIVNEMQSNKIKSIWKIPTNI